MQLGPLIFKPKLKPKIWGGQRLRNYGREFAPGLDVGESWDIYDRPEASAEVSQGPFCGQTLNSLMHEFGPALLGPSAFSQGPAYFPMMIKLIDAKEALSVQVHPDDIQALRMVGPGESGKTEMWVVLEAIPGATMVAGLKASTTRKAFLEALREGRLESVLNEIPVEAGDAVLVPAGCLHAIGKGCLVAEIQQNSDLTWRVHDYGRLEGGKVRALHLDQALECIRFEEPPPLRIQRQAECSQEDLGSCPYFRVTRIRLRATFRPPQEAPAYHLVTVTRGAVLVHFGRESQVLGLGMTALLPASLAWSLEASQSDSEVLWSRPGAA